MKWLFCGGFSSARLDLQRESGEIIAVEGGGLEMGVEVMNMSR
ncbi:MAG TPA: hypothetical protein PLX85_05940 [Dehalococcoidia bacterium]|nr:hypothetical protein [Dehalococcoidia bacterium]